MIANLFQQLGSHTNIEIEENILRHMVLNSIRSFVVRFKKDYGELVIACDARNSWRREKFQPYKANRKKSRDQSDLDWDMIFTAFGKFRVELAEVFPYRVIDVEGAEADDVIAVLTQEFQSHENKILILSSDKDFQQLQKFKNVEQYNPARDEWIVCNNPTRFLLEHIIRGDRSDGIPNILSPDNSFIDNIRQKPIMQKNLDIWLEDVPDHFCINQEMYNRFERNKELIDFDCIPKDIKDNIMSAYVAQRGKNKQKLLEYFTTFHLKNLTEHINEF